MSTPFSAAKNYLKSTLASAFSTFQDSFTVATGGTGFPAGRQIVRITDGTNNELILVASRSGSTLTAASGGRGYGGTTARSWSIGATVELVMTANHLDELQSAVNAMEKLPLHSWGMTTGIYTVPFRNDSFSNIGLQKDRLYLVPILISEEVTASSLWCKITAGGSAGSLVRLGLYKPIGGMKFDLVTDAGTVAGDAVTEAGIGISKTLPPALYAGAILHNSATNIQFRAATLSGAGWYHLFPQPTLEALVHLPYKGVTYGALPTSLLPPYTFLSGANIPLVGIGVT